MPPEWYALQTNSMGHMPSILNRGSTPSIEQIANRNDVEPFEFLSLLAHCARNGKVIDVAILQSVLKENPRITPQHTPMAFGPCLTGITDHLQRAPEQALHWAKLSELLSQRIAHSGPEVIATAQVFAEHGVINSRIVNARELISDSEVEKTGEAALCEIVRCLQFTGRILYPGRHFASVSGPTTLNRAVISPALRIYLPPLDEDSSLISES